MHYRDPQDHLNDHLQRVRLMLQRHMRRHSERFISGDGDYTDRSIGASEVRRMLNGAREGGGQALLDHLGVKELQQVEDELGMREAMINARLEKTEALETSVVLPIESLRKSFRLSFAEVDLLIAAAAPRLSMTFSRLYPVAWVDFSCKQPSAGFLAELTTPRGEKEHERVGLFEARRALQKYRLIITHEHPRWVPSTPLLHAPIEVPQRVVDFLQGRGLDTSGLDGCTLHQRGRPLEEIKIRASTLQTLERIVEQPTSRLRLLGPQGVGRRTSLIALCQRAGIRLLEADLLSVFESAQGQDFTTALAEVLREARLHQALLLLRADELIYHELTRALDAHMSRLRGLLRDYPGGVVVSAPRGHQVLQNLLGPIQELKMRPPEEADQRELWLAAISAHQPTEQRFQQLAVELARQYRLPPGDILRAVENAAELCGAKTDDSPQGFSPSALITAVQQQFDHQLGGIATPMTTDVSVEDIVMTEEAANQIEEVFRYARNADKVFREWGLAKKGHGGHGLSVLFSGPPGTGKTLVACALATSLGRAIYRVDLSQVVDKYVGETEKNLGRVFDEAERAQAVILFDEADSIFSKRTEVKSSNDRYANLEVNYLLQRLENFNGVAILTTNFVQSIDEAFMRRIRFKIDFPIPDNEMRADLWRKLLPPNAPIEDGIYWEGLGENFELSGGHIRNAILRASLFAADSQISISEALLWDAAVAECREMGVLVATEFSV